ncbi:hypothetical protein [Georgenia yuyongxinii]
MDDAQRGKLEQRRGEMKAVLAAIERRHEVADVVYSSSDADDARRRVSKLLGIEAGEAEAVISTQFRRFSDRERSVLVEEVDDIARALSAG